MSEEAIAAIQATAPVVESNFLNFYNYLLSLILHLEQIEEPTPNQAKALEIAQSLTSSLNSLRINESVGLLKLQTEIAFPQN